MIASVAIPYFAPSIAQRQNPVLRKMPLALVRYTSARGQIYAVCQQAARSGVAPGMTPPQARALCPDVQLELADLNLYRRAFEHMLEILRDYSNYLEPKKLTDGQTAIFFLDFGKLRPSDAKQLSQKLIESVQQQTGLCVSIGLASGKYPAFVAATGQNPGHIHLIPKGQEAAFLAPFPITLLPFGKEPIRRLKLLGINTIGQFAALPRAAVFAQFGQKGRRLHRWASGQDDRRVPFFKPERVEYADCHFDPPIADKLILESVLRKTADQLAQRLEADGLECSEVALVIRLEDNSARDADIALAQPISRNADIYKKLWFLHKQIVITCGVTNIEVRLSAIHPLLPRQLSLFGDEQNTQELHDVFVNLAARHGDCFFTLTPRDPGSWLTERRFDIEHIEIA